jgi:hypothetical protein
MALHPRARSRRTRLTGPLHTLLALSLIWASGSEAGRAQTMDPAPGAGGSAVVLTSTAGAKGAQVYCFMRSAGNSHDVSWTAAYALIKRQSASLFKTSPEHAAVMITEAVVQNPGSYPDCGKYLGELFEKAAARDAAAAATAGNNTPAATEATKPATGSSRYSY